MLKNFIKLIFIWLLFIGGVVPVSASNGVYYIYRSTVTGTNVVNSNGIVYEIVDQKSSFSVNEPIKLLTRIFNITNIDSFRFKYDLSVEDMYYKTFYSQIYYPHRNWWAETYSVADLGTISAGNYRINVLLSINGGNYVKVDSKIISVNNNHYNFNNGYYNHNYSNYDYTVYNCDTYDRQTYQLPAPKYSFNWTHTGTSVNNRGGNNYETANSKTNFNNNENVYALTKISNIQGIDSFRIKQELYLGGNSFYQANESSLQVTTPIYNFWTNFGSLPRGYHEIRTYISINGGAYTILDRKSISFGQNDISEKRNFPFMAKTSYRYGGAQSGNTIDHLYGYTYQINNPKNTFSTNEDVITLSKISDIRYIDNFRIKYELYKDSSLIKTIEAAVQYPRNNYWEYNHAFNNFGKLSAGNYTIKIYVSINGGFYNYLGANSVIVTNYFARYDNHDLANDHFYCRRDCRQ
jgi:hypothetical protein